MIGKAAAIVRHSFYPFELNVKREADALREAGFDVHVVCLRDPGEAGYEVIDGVHVHRLPVTHRRGSIARYLWEYNAFFVLASAKLTRLHRRHRFVSVQVNTMPDYLVFTALYPKLTGAKVILHLHEPVPELFQTMFPGRWYTRAFVRVTAAIEQSAIRFADRVLTVTEQMRDNYIRRGADPSKFTVIVNVPDNLRFDISRSEHLRDRVDAVKREEGPRGVFRVLTHGAIEERYGFDTIVRAVAALKEDIPGIQFRFMGAGDDLPNVLALARDLGVEDRVRHLGFVPFEAMVEEILLADVCVIAVKRSPYSVLVHTNKMYEYMALRRPIVASRLDSVAAYAPDEAVLYFEPGGEESLAAALQHAFENPGEMARRVEAAGSVYARWRWDKERNKYLSNYADTPLT